MTTVRPSAPDRNDTPLRSTWTRRLAAILAAAAAASIAFAAERYGAGLSVDSPGMNGRDPSPVGPGAVVAVTLIAGVAGWALLAVLERFATRARRTWTAAATAVAVASLSGPMSGGGISVSNRLALVLLHATVAATLIPFLRRTSSPGGSDRAGRGL